MDLIDFQLPLYCFYPAFILASSWANPKRTPGGSQEAIKQTVNYNNGFIITTAYKDKQLDNYHNHKW